ncbi:MAG: cobalt-precorrin-5B (C(1))-methyltransferase [Desulfovibrionaceae bacterium]|nr:cobalt-precorrin-5B (C(1))-methyltransferase [Desulfovibrionaceae bacterium]
MPTLREGFTTGTAAAGASIAALTLLLTGKPPQAVSVPLPPIDNEGCPRTWLVIPIASCAQGVHPSLANQKSPPSAAQASVIAAHACVIKDAGDDPDVTNHAAIYASVLLGEESLGRMSFQDAQEFITLEGGIGIGRATLPGLPIPVGEWAINPAPRRQIRAGLWHCLRSMRPIRCILCVPEGEKIAEKTFNPRLGIVGGISLLGTHGTVKPYSHEAFIATIAEQLAIAYATGERELFFSTGRRSEKALQTLYPTQSVRAFIQVGDHMGASLALARKGSFSHITVGLFFGKLAKIAQGHLATHAHESTLNIEALSALCKTFGICPSDPKSRTARHILEALPSDPNGAAFIRHMVSLAHATMAKESPCPLTVCLFDANGQILCQSDHTR